VKVFTNSLSLCQTKVKNDAKAFAAGNLTKKQDI
jgi:hypothetical protein